MLQSIDIMQRYPPQRPPGPFADERANYGFAASWVNDSKYLDEVRMAASHMSLRSMLSSYARPPGGRLPRRRSVHAKKTRREGTGKTSRAALAAAEMEAQREREAAAMRERLRVLEEEEAARQAAVRRIQSTQRVRTARREHRASEDAKNQKECAAATRIQAGVRGKLLRDEAGRRRAREQMPAQEEEARAYSAEEAKRSAASTAAHEPAIAPIASTSISTSISRPPPSEYDLGLLETRGMPAWVLRLMARHQPFRFTSPAEYLHRPHNTAKPYAEYQKPTNMVASILFASKEDRGRASSPHATRHSVSPRSRTGTLDVPYPMRMFLCSWARQAGLPRGLALRILVLRSGHRLDSPVIGKLPIGSEAFVLETRVEVRAARSITRALVAASTAAPLGWVTSIGEAGDAYLSMLQPGSLPVSPQLRAAVQPAGAVGREVDPRIKPRLETAPKAAQPHVPASRSSDWRDAAYAAQARPLSFADGRETARRSAHTDRTRSRASARASRPSTGQLSFRGVSERQGPAAKQVQL